MVMIAFRWGVAVVASVPQAGWAPGSRLFFHLQPILNPLLFEFTASIAVVGLVQGAIWRYWP